jgi:diguanylate cyclase (GGDEF)-like protein/PAS domain S-box-containing protein
MALPLPVPEKRPLEFGRVDPNSTDLSDAVYTVGTKGNLLAQGPPALTWTFDPVSGAVCWPRSPESFFGFDHGVLGFSVSDERGGQQSSGCLVSGEACLGEAICSLLGGEAGDDGVFEETVYLSCPDGVEHCIVLRCEIAGEGGVYAGVLFDVTDQMQFANELGGLVDRYRLLSDISPDAVIVHLDGTLVYGNKAAMHLIGAESVEAHIGDSMLTYLHPDDVLPVLERVGQLQDDGQYFEHGEARIVALDGVTRVVEITSVRTTWGGKPAFQVIMRDMSERKAAEAAAQYRASLVAHVADAIIGVEIDGSIESWNEAAASIYGWDEDEVLGRPANDVLGGLSGVGETIVAAGRATHYRKDHTPVDVLVSVDPLMANDETVGWVVVCTELTDAKLAEAGRREAEERYASVVASLSEGILLFDADGNVSASNEAAEKILGERLTSGGGSVFTTDALAVDNDGEALALGDFPHIKTLNTGEPEVSVVVGVRDNDGRRQWLSISARRLHGDPVGVSPNLVVCSFTDVTVRREAEEELSWLAYHDPVTRLGNRSLLCDALESELIESEIRDSNLAVVYLDIDRFKMINDSFGHASGDEVLVNVATRFKALGRSGDVISRFSGDEFVILCRNVAGLDAACEIAEAYAGELIEPIELSCGRSIALTCSAGVSLVHGGGYSVADVLVQADAAMFSAKDKGRNRVEAFSAALAAKSVAKLELYEDLKEALATGGLEVYYQPITSTGTGRVKAVEALVRWHHPTRGMVSPAEFIPFAEETDLIFELGRFVLREACFTMARWRSEVPGAEAAYVTVNLSAHQLADITAALHDSGLSADGLVLEVTESILMDDVDAATAILNNIDGLGVGLAIDDFGTGYSSMSQLKMFPVKILKIDKAFIDGLGAFERDDAIVTAVVQLARAFGMIVTAEGVETAVQLERVTELGCDLYQGYLMSKPTPAGDVDFSKRLSAQDALAAAEGAL